jgi:dihydrofolate reductase
MNKPDMDRPEVILIAAMSIDGFIAPADKESLPSTTWTSKEDWHFFTKKSKEIGTMIMGSRTFETIKKALPERRTVVMTSQPERYAEFNDPNLLFTAESPEEILANLDKEGVKQVALCGGASIYNLFLQKNLVNKMFLTVEPYVFGEGVKLFNEKIEKRFSLLQQTKLNDSGTILLEYST